MDFEILRYSLAHGSFSLEDMAKIPSLEYFSKRLLIECINKNNEEKVKYDYEKMKAMVGDRKKVR